MLFIGDVHGKVEEYKKILDAHPEELSIQVGDFGFKEHHEWHLKNIDNGAHRINFGNHDDYSYCYKPHSLGDCSMRVDIMTIRGADSIDKHLRTEGVSWWRQEELSYLFFQTLLEKTRRFEPRIIVSHDCPQSIREKFFGIYDKSTTSNGLQAILEAWKPEIWIFGHHHIRKDEVVDGVRFICLEELGTIII